MLKILAKLPLSKTQGYGQEVLSFRGSLLLRSIAESVNHHLDFQRDNQKICTQFLKKYTFIENSWFELVCSK